MNYGNRPTVYVLGTRGIPDIQGGIETHVRMLYPFLVKLGYEVVVLQRAPYFPRQSRKRSWHGVQLRYLWVPKIVIVETALHTLFGIVYAAIKRPNLLHIHGIGPATLVPLARLFGLRVIVTHHTFDYRREKWGVLARSIFGLGERWGMKYGNGRIVVSREIQDYIKSTYGLDSMHIPNGARICTRTKSDDALRRFNLKSGKYVLCVARLEATKRHLDLMEAFELCDAKEWKLVLVGGLQENDSYTKKILERASHSKDIVLTDFQRGRALSELYSHAGLFVLPSSHEGQPIALLEALSYGLPVFASAIEANLAVPIPECRYFRVGDVIALARLMTSEMKYGSPDENWEEVRADIRNQFAWKRSAKLTCQVYQDALE